MIYNIIRLVCIAACALLSAYFVWSNNMLNAIYLAVIMLAGIVDAYSDTALQSMRECNAMLRSQGEQLKHLQNHMAKLENNNASNKS